MNADIKKRWIDALRSGGYQQTTGVLHDEDANGFCCLGVLCDIAVKEGVVKSAELRAVESGDRDGRRVTAYDYEFGVLPDSVKVWADIPVSNPDVIIDNRQTSLAEENDGGKTFSEIADIIEEQL
jgi:hypothetical protein